MTSTALERKCKVGAKCIAGLGARLCNAARAACRRRCRTTAKAGPVAIRALVLESVGFVTAVCSSRPCSSSRHAAYARAEGGALHVGAVMRRPMAPPARLARAAAPGAEEGELVPCSLALAVWRRNTSPKRRGERGEWANKRAVRLPFKRQVGVGTCDRAILGRSGSLSNIQECLKRNSVQQLSHFRNSPTQLPLSNLCGSPHDAGIRGRHRVQARRAGISCGVRGDADGAPAQPAGRQLQRQAVGAAQETWLHPAGSRSARNQRRRRAFRPSNVLSPRMQRAWVI